MPVTLYKRQREIFDYICQYIDKYGHSPTLQEIATAMELASLATVHEHLKALEKKEIIRRYEGAVRGIEITYYRTRKINPITSEEQYDAGMGINVPLIGFIAAGRPIEAIEDPTTTIAIPPDLVSGGKRTFVLQVRGDSMVEAGILDGDFVVIEQSNTAENGDIVVALLDNEMATLKRFYKLPDERYKLEPANSSMAPIYVDNLTIQGLVKGVIRKYQ